MKSVFVKILSLSLCILMLVGSLAACKKKPTPPPDTIPDDSNVVPPGKEYETDENGYIKDSITQKFNGTELNMLTWDERRDYLFPEQNSSNNSVISAVYSRNLDISERLDIFLNVTSVPGEWSKYDTFIQQAELAGELGFDIICSYSLWPSVLASRGVLYNLNNLTYPELDMPWWPESIKEWEQYGSLFFVADNSSIPVINSMELCFANLPLITNSGLEDPIQLVLNGTWTLEKLIQYTEVFGAAYRADDPEAIYGIVVDEISRMDSFFYGAGFNATRNNIDGKAESAFTSQEAREQITTLISQLGRMFDYGWSNILVNSSAPMKNNKTAFQIASMSHLFSMKDNTNYAALPMPKRDLTQTRYYTCCNNSFNVWCIPDSTANAEVSATVIEAFASSAYRKLAPYYYEDNLKLRYSSNDDGAQVFDIIRSSVLYDFGRISTKSIGAAETAFRRCFWDYNLETPRFSNDYVSHLDTLVTTYETNLAELLQAYRKYQSR